MRPRPRSSRARVAVTSHTLKSSMSKRCTASEASTHRASRLNLRLRMLRTRAYRSRSSRMASRAHSRFGPICDQIAAQLMVERCVSVSVKTSREVVRYTW